MATTEETDQQVPDPQTKEEKKDSFVDFLKELPILVVVAFGIALLIKTFLVQAFYIPSGSMEDTLLIKDRVLVSKMTYKYSHPKYGDVVVFVSPLEGTNPKIDRGPIGNLVHSLGEGMGLQSSERDFIKRVIATEGQTVQVKQGHVFVNNKQLKEPYTKKTTTALPDYGPTKVPKDKVFVMGDNRNNSQDSRVFGPIKTSTIVGRAFVLLWPVDRFHWLGRF